MPERSSLFTSSVGTKFIMAITGCLLFLFILIHLLGNLQLYLGQETFNAYGQSLKDLPTPITWGVRITLIVLVGLHSLSAIRLVRINRAAKPNKYKHAHYNKTSYAARTMIYSGLIIGAFVLYHLAHYTFLWTHPEYALWHDGAGRHDIYRMVIAGFRSPIISLFYLIAVGLLCIHLSHGLSSMFQSLGIQRCTRDFLKKSGRIIAWIVFLGYASIPISILLGVVTLEGIPS